MQSTLKITLVLAGILLLAAPVSAADGQFAIGSNLGYFSLTGDDFETADPGFGVNGNVRYNMPNNFGVNAAVQWNKHGIDGTDDSFNMLAIALEPRYNIEMQNPMFTPFVGARGMWVKQSGDAAGLDISSSGFGFGATAGMMFNVSSQFGIEAGVGYDAISMGNLDIDGTELPDSEASGGSFNFSAGFVYNFPK